MCKSITTKVGDKGTTFLFSGEEVPKNSERTEAYGDLDELVSQLGVARAAASRADTRERVLALQKRLFVVGSELATMPDKLPMLRERVDAKMLAELEAFRVDLESRIKRPPGFVVPGGTLTAAHLDLARTIARRLERKIVGLTRTGELANDVLLVWINRVSDYLWLLARLEEGEATTPK
ncbi:MAG: cob(I)yrinic acid a,c-diamide adenosyltransferase [bacterium]